MWRAWRDDEFVIDPSRVTIEITRTGVDGDTFKHTHLMDQYGIQVNKTSRNTVLFMTNIGTSRSAIAYLIEVLVKLAERFERDRATRGLPEARTDDDAMPPLPDFSAFAPACASLGTARRRSARGVLRRTAAGPDRVCDARGAARAGRARGATGLGGLRDAVPSRLPGARAGQIVTAEVLDFMAALDTREIHGYDAARGYRLIR
jgi:arginine decarboxylase